MNFQSKKIMPRYFVITVLLGIAGLAVLGKAAYIMFMEKDYWEAVSDRFVKENVEILPNRGNIISADGQLMASSLPEYKIYMDYVAGDRDSVKKARQQAWKDSVFFCKLDSICEGLHQLFPDRTAKQFRKHLLKGYEKKSRNWLIYPKRISYIKYKETKQLPLFRLSPYKGGFHAIAYNQRKKPFGSLATRTLGELYGGKDTARFGLELAYDSILRGTSGITHRQKVMNKYLNIVDIPPQDGLDIMTTIDVEMQDICEKALIDKLKEINARVGVAILMETATGDVKAIVNMTKCADGEYREIRNNAVSDLLEPGSVFKTASFMVAFEDGYIHMNDSVDVGCGIMDMHGRKMKDHNWRRGGYQWLTVPEILEYSSNIGVSYCIDKYYYDNPQKYVSGLYQTGIAEDLKLPIPGYAKPRIRMPKKDGSNWSKTALAWMSIGYESQVPPISTVSFYNGIANGGKMMRPRFVKAVMRDGEIVREFPTEVVRERMCSPQTLKNIQTCLRWVVSRGLGKKAGSESFQVSGKTGTAQIWTSAGFSSQYLVSFVGYFPSEAPLYSCIVCIQKGLPASGGGQCGPVFKRIAEAVMARNLESDITTARDTINLRYPYVKNGDLKAAETVMTNLLIPCQTTGNADWGTAESNEEGVILRMQRTESGTVPDVRGMGARDAIYRLERQGFRTSLKGIGKVTKQSIMPGKKAVKGTTVALVLDCDLLRKERKKQVTRHKHQATDTIKQNPASMPAKQTSKTTSKKKHQ